MRRQQVQHQIGGLPADAQLGLADQRQIRKDFTEQLQLVKTDDGKIFRDADVLMLQGKHRAQGHFKIGDEQGGRALFQFQQRLHSLITAVHGIIAVTDIVFRRRDPGFLQRVQISRKTLICGIKPRAAQHQADPAMTEIRQFPDGLQGSMNVVNNHGAGFSAKAFHQPVHQQHRDAGVQRSFQMGAGGIGGHIDEPVHPAVQQEFNGFLFALRIASAVADDHGVIMPAQDVLHGGYDRGNEGVTQLRNDDTDYTAMACFQAAGYLIRNIVQFFDSSVNQNTVLITNCTTVKVFGDCSQSEPGLPGNIFHCRSHWITSGFLN